MTEYTKLIERLGSRYGVPDLSTDQLLTRRDRKRRNQRIMAGVVGIAVFVAAVWIVTSVKSLDRSENSVVPAGEVTGPTATGPTSAANPEAFSVSGGFLGLPPEGAALSDPARGEVVANGDSYRYFASLYADGRLIWEYDDSLWLERRLTPEGVDLVRSQPELLERSHPGLLIAFWSLPVSAWEDPGAKQYAASLYGVCTSREAIRHLPQQAQDLLGDVTDKQAVERGEVEFFAGGNGSTCPEVTLEEARQLDEILGANGYRRTDHAGEGVWYGYQGMNPYIVVLALLPDGALAQSGGA
jgi:hypothetical protein